MSIVICMMTMPRTHVSVHSRSSIYCSLHISSRVEVGASASYDMALSKLRRTHSEDRLADSYDDDTESLLSLVIHPKVFDKRSRIGSQINASHCISILAGITPRSMHHGCDLGQLCVVEDASHTLIGYEASITFLARGNSTLMSPILLSQGVVYWMRVAWDESPHDSDIDVDPLPEGRVRRVVRVCPARALKSYVLASALTPRKRDLILDMMRRALDADD